MTRFAPWTAQHEEGMFAAWMFLANGDPSTWLVSFWFPLPTQHGESTPGIPFEYVAKRVPPSSILSLTWDAGRGIQKVSMSAGAWDIFNPSSSSWAGMQILNVTGSHGFASSRPF